MKTSQRFLTAATALSIACGAAAGTIPGEYRNILGEGEAYATLTLRWGDALALDNLASAVRMDGSATAGDIIATALREDPRFYAMRDVAGNYVAFGFDTNGDNSASVNLNGSALDLADGVATATEDYAGATGSSQYDHWSVNGDGGAWRVLVNGSEAGLDTEVSDGNSVLLEYVAADAHTAADYIFYLRPATERGVWMQPEILFDTANGKQQYFPMISNCINTAELYGMGVGFEFVDPATGGNSTTMNAYLANAKAGGNSVRLTAQGPAPVLVKPYLNLRIDGATTRVYTDEPAKVSLRVAHPVTGLRMEGWPEGDIRLYDMFGFRVYAEPDDADFPNVIYELSDPAAAEVYVKSAYQFDHFFAHNTGSFTLTARTADGSCELTQDFTIIDRDRTDAGAEDFQDGTLWLNEEWFGHSNGSINYIRPDGSILLRAYELANPFEGFGCTSQYATVYGGKLLVMSKQYQDGGDPRTGGGRLTVVDAATMKKLASFNTLDGTDPAVARSSQDGRACVGVNPHKAYIGASGSISVLDLDNLTLTPGGVKGLPAGGSAYSSQYGDMVCAGDYVFVVRQSNGVIVIDGRTDEYVKTIENKNVQGIARTADGNVWYVDYNQKERLSKIYCINPATLEIEKEYALPSTVSCEWGSWRSTRFFAARRSNKLFWNNNYCWDLDADETPENIAPLVTSDDDRWPMTTNGKKQSVFASAAYDDRSGEILWSGSQGFGTDARFTWYNFTDVNTGDIRSVRVEPDYYYFPSIPVIPDKHRPALNDPDFAVQLSLDTPAGVVLDLDDIIDDIDNARAHIRYSLAPEALSDESDPVAGRAEVKLEGRTLTLVPRSLGDTSVNLIAESNGNEQAISIPVKIGKATGGIADAETFRGQVSCEGGNITVSGMEGCGFAVYDMEGRMATAFSADSDYYTRRLELAAGVYVLACDNGRRFKIVINRSI